MAIDERSPAQADQILRNKQEAVAIFDFHGLRNEESGKKVIALLDFLIDKIRTQNDTADVNSVIFNQGQLKVLKDLRQYIDIGLPTMTKNA